MIFIKKNAWLVIFLMVACNQSKKPGDANKDVIASDSISVNTKVLASGLNYPWEILWGPDNFIWMTERGGTISRVDPASGSVSRLITIKDVVANGEGGLLGMVLHPDFTNHPSVFVAYNYNNGNDYQEKIVCYTYNGTTLVDPIIIFDHIEGAGNHDGCRLAIGPDLKLYITTGDAGDQSLPQDVSAVNGKILRLNLDGSVPADNPVAGNPYWTFGHRNPQGLVFANNNIYSAEHGPNTDDEINIIEKGKNYGWPDVHGFCDEADEKTFCAAHSVKEPIKAWTPTAAISGLDYYNKKLIGAWKNSLLVVSLKNARLYQMQLDSTFTTITNTREYFTNRFGRLRDICISPDGKVYICTCSGGDDKIIVVTPGS